MAIMRQVGKSKPTVWRWQQRFLEEGVDGLLRDRNRGTGKRPLSPEVRALVLAKTVGEKPPNASHWSLRTMAKAVGIGHTSVQRIWAEHGLKPHLVSTFKLSNDPRLAEKVADVVGLYLNPPDKALVLSVDEKSQIQALDRTQPGLPMKKGRAGTMTHDYKRHGTTTLFAALNVLDGTVIGQCMKRHRHQEFLRFLRKLDRETTKQLDIHLIVDNYATHKHAKIKEWLEKQGAQVHFRIRRRPQAPAPRKTWAQTRARQSRTASGRAEPRRSQGVTAARYPASRMNPMRSSEGGATSVWLSWSWAWPRWWVWWLKAWPSKAPSGCS